MLIIVNGKERTLTESVSVSEFVAGQGLKPETVVIELNGEILDRLAWADQKLKPGDSVEIVSFMGGGC